MSRLPIEARSEVISPATLVLRLFTLSSLETAINLDGYETDKFISSALPNSNTTVSRHGQVTPPRSISAAGDPKSEQTLSPKSQPTERRKRGTRQRDGRQVQWIRSPPASTYQDKSISNRHGF